jgi:hypothetical protein
MSFNKSDEKRKLNFSEDQNENINDDNSLKNQQINNSLNCNNGEVIEDSSKRPVSFFETILKNKNRININYDDLDFQKGESSPRHLFRKRKPEIPVVNLESNIKEKSSTRAHREKDKDRETIYEDSVSLTGKDTSNNLNLNINSANNLTNALNASNLSSSNPYYNLRELHSGNISQTSNSYLQSYYNEDIKVANKIRITYDNYLDFVHDSYFGDNTSNNKDLNSQHCNSSLTLDDTLQSWNNNFKFTSLDLLVNPLRQKFIWETWSPYDIALFECCVCKFNRNFDMYSRIVSKIFILINFNILIFIIFEFKLKFILINTFTIIDKNKNKRRDSFFLLLLETIKIL